MLMKTLTLKPWEYLELKECFQGGFTHANAHRVNLIHQKVGSYDFTSSYPACMVAFEFPMGKGVPVGEIGMDALFELCKTNCCMFRLAFTNLVPLNNIEHPISISKCRKSEEAHVDNGRVITAKYLETTCTEQDLKTYLYFYDFESIRIFDCVAYPKGYLPTPFVKTILKLYKDKTVLKGIKGEELNYLLSKEMLNSAYGMTVTDIVREALEYDKDDITGCKSNYDDENFDEVDFLTEQISRYNDNPYRFLFYAWGVWVTAYARANLFSGIRAAGRDYIYSDTDSIKITHPELHTDYINSYNNEITERLRLACEFHGIDFEETRPKNSKGEEKPLGVWEFEGIYDEFKTLGAKRYLWRKGGDWQLTAAGVNKTMGMKYLLKRAKELKCSPFDLFSLNLVIPKEYSGRLVLTYIDEPVTGSITDYLGNPYSFEEKSSIHMGATEYSFNPVDEFIKYLFEIREEQW